VKQLRSVTIENFQSHKHTSLTLAPGTNVIVGASDSGKSAILRALNWVVTNRPLGDAFRSDWGGETRVVVTTTDGHVVERVRSASRNDYIVDGAVLTAFGTEVPQEVLEVLPLDAFSFQNQMDAPFLLAASPGEAARLLNRAASLDEIDLVLANLNRTQLSLNRDIKATQAQIATYKEQLAEYDDLPALEDRLRLVEAEEVSYHTRMGAVREKKALLERAKEVTAELSTLRSTAPAEALLAALQEAVPHWAAGHERLIALRALVQRTRQLQGALAMDAPPEQADALLDQIEEAVPRWATAKARIDACRQLVRQADRLWGEIATVEGAERTAQEEYQRIAPDECPLCGSPMRQEGR
jgi:exonuclease SbcC